MIDQKRDAGASRFFYGYPMDINLKTRICLLLLVFVVLGVYYPVIFSPLNPIDDQGIYNYLLNTDIYSFSELFAPVGSANYYRPVLWLTFWVDKYLWGLEESFMHLGNLFIHLCNSLLLFAVARKAAQRLDLHSPVIPLVAALFFAMHPLNSEPVNWIAGRADLLAGFFVILSVLILLCRTGGVASYLAALCLLVGCLAKETAIFFLPMAIALPFFLYPAENNRPSLKIVLLRNRWHFLNFIAAGIGFFFLRALALSRGDKGISSVLSHVAGGQGDDWLIKLQILLKAAGFYLKKLFIPFPLNFSIVHVSNLYLPLGILFFLVLVWLLTKRTLPTFFLLSAAAIASSALLVPLLQATWTPLAERYMYVPSAFFVVGITLLGYRFTTDARYRPFVSGLVIVIALVAIYGTATRTLLWQDNHALFADTLRKSPGFRPIQAQVVNNYFSAGKTSQAIALASSIDVSDQLTDFQFGLLTQAGALAQAGDFEGARDLYEKALENPGEYETMLLRGLLALYDARIIELSAGHESLFIAKIPLLIRLYDLGGDAFYLYRLGQAYLAVDNKDAARDAFTRCAAAAPPRAHYRQAALTLSQNLSKSVK